MLNNDDSWGAGESGAVAVWLEGGNWGPQLTLGRLANWRVKQMAEKETKKQWNYTCLY